jgi:hypothetical protein
MLMIFKQACCDFTELSESRSVNIFKSNFSRAEAMNFELIVSSSATLSDLETFNFDALTGFSVLDGDPVDVTPLLLLPAPDDGVIFFPVSLLFDPLPIFEFLGVCVGVK